MPPIESCIIDSTGTIHPLTTGREDATEVVHLGTVDKSGKPRDLQIFSFPKSTKDRSQGAIWGPLARDGKPTMFTDLLSPDEHHTWGSLTITAVNGIPFDAPKPHTLSVETPK